LAYLFTAENAESAEMVERENLDRIAVDHRMPVHQAQLLSYLNLSGCKVGLPINCNVRVLPEGWHSPSGEVRATGQSPLQILCVLRGLCGKQMRQPTT